MYGIPRSHLHNDAKETNDVANSYSNRGVPVLTRERGMSPV